MPYQIRVSIIGEGEHLPVLIRSILEKQVIPASNLYLPQNNAGAKAGAEGYAVNWMPDEQSTVIKGEVVMVCASKREFATVLSPVCNCTRGRTLVCLCPSDEVTVDYVAERVAFGTEISTAPLTVAADGSVSAKICYAKSVRAFLREPCMELVRAFCPCQPAE